MQSDHSDADQLHIVPIHDDDMANQPQAVTTTTRLHVQGYDATLDHVSIDKVSPIVQSSSPSTSLQPSPSSSSSPPLVPAALFPSSLSTRLILLLLVTLTYFTCQLHRWSIGVVSEALEQSLHFGDGHGGGLEYQLLAGPCFNLLFTSMGVVGAIAIVVWGWNRVWMLAGELVLACMATAGMGLANNYAQLAIARAAQGLSQAICSAASAGLIGAYFPMNQRGFAMAVYNLGIYGGYGAAFGIGNFITDRWSWRTLFFVMSIPAAVLAAALMLFVKDPVWEQKRQERKEMAGAATGQGQKTSSENIDLIGSHSTIRQLESPLLPDPNLDTPLDSPISTASGSPSIPATDAPSDVADQPSSAVSTVPPRSPLASALHLFLTTPALSILLLAASVRTGAGITWGYTTQQFFHQIRGVSKTEISAWMSWLPPVFGSLGAVLGGVCSDRIFRRWGSNVRIGMLVASQVLATPCAAAVLLLPAPFSFLMIIPTYVIGEAYIGVGLSMLLDMSPSNLHSFVAAIYVFVVANLGGNANLLLPPTQDGLLNGGLTWSLMILWPGFILLSAGIYALLWKWSGTGKSTMETASNQSKGESDTAVMSAKSLDSTSLDWFKERLLDSTSD